MHVAYDASTKNDVSTNAVFRIGLINPLETRDPRRGINFANMSIIWTLYEPVYRSTAPGQVEAIMLEYPLREEPSSSGLPVYSAGVKPGIRFTDGTEVTAQHIAESLSKTVSFASQAITTARGDRVFFLLNRRNANFQFVLARHDHPIILERGTEFLGTGPYMLGPNSTPEHFRLLRNPHYYRNVPGPAEIECRVYPLDAAGRRDRLMEAVSQGQVDFTEDLLREQIAQTQHMRRIIDLGFCTAILYFNTQRSIFADAPVRRAVAAAIDRRALAEQSYSNPLAFTAAGVVPPSLGTYSDGMRFDLPRAREMFASANAGQASKPLVMWVVPVPRPHLPNPYATAQLLAKQIGELGLAIEIKQARSVAHFYEITSRGSYDLLLSGWIPDTSDPLDIMETLFTSDCIPDSSDATRGSNFARWSNAEFDETVQIHRTAPHETELGKNLPTSERPGPRLPLDVWPAYGRSVVARKEIPTRFRLPSLPGRNRVMKNQAWTNPLLHIPCPSSRAGDGR